MSQAYWQAKIWGLLHDPALKALHDKTGRGNEGVWQSLACMQGEGQWGSPKSNQSPKDSNYSRQWLKHIGLCDLIASASDRAAIGSLDTSVNYAPESHPNKGLEIHHLLSGEKLNFKLNNGSHQKLIQLNRGDHLNQLEQELLNPMAAETDCKKVFWWLWRCLPEAVCQKFQDESLMLMPADTRLPDASIWSHTSVTAALAGALAGYNLSQADIQARWSLDNILSHPYLATFSFTPVQELIKASRKMRDLWAGSWILHYLSAKVCWKLASIYGPDSLLYPSLYQQPLIDHWLLQTWPNFSKWIEQPSSQKLLTAGLPNVLVLVLPKDAVRSAMQTAQQTLLEEWRQLGNFVFKELQTKQGWMSKIQPNSQTWAGWLDAQWQTYWTALPIGIEGKTLTNDAIPEDRSDEFQPWQNAQNYAYKLVREKEQLFQPAEMDFLRAAYQHRWETPEPKFSINVGSWWPYIFDQTRFALTAVKNARTWQLPTAFGPRSTVSGIGPVVHPGDDWITEKETKQLWQRQAGLFDGREQLNATETLKRGLHKILPQILNLEEGQIAASYPDLTVGVAGYLKVNTESEEHRRHFYQTCQAVINEFPWARQVVQEVRGKWGIPWVDNNSDPKKYHPRLLNSGWLAEDAQTNETKALQQDLESESDSTGVEQLSQEIDRLNGQPEETPAAALSKLKVAYQSSIQKIIDHYYPSNNPADSILFG